MQRTSLMLLLAGLAAACEPPAMIDDASGHHADDTGDVHFVRGAAPYIGRVELPIQDARAFRAVAIRTTEAVDPLEVSIELQSGKVEVAIAAQRNVYSVINLPNASTIKKIEVRGVPEGCGTDLAGTTDESFAGLVDAVITSQFFRLLRRVPGSDFFPVDIPVPQQNLDVNTFHIHIDQPVRFEEAIVTATNGENQRVELVQRYSQELYLSVELGVPTAVAKLSLHTRGANVRHVGGHMKGFIRPIPAQPSSKPRTAALPPSEPSSM
jgi:hypothetical protein